MNNYQNNIIFRNLDREGEYEIESESEMDNDDIIKMFNQLFDYIFENRTDIKEIKEKLLKLEEKQRGGTLLSLSSRQQTNKKYYEKNKDKHRKYYENKKKENELLRLANEVNAE